MNPVKRDPVTGLFVKADSEPVGQGEPDPMPEATPSRKPRATAPDSLEKRIVDLVTPTIEQAIAQERRELEKAVREELDKIPKRIEIGFPDGSTRSVSGAHHPALEPALKRLAAGLPLYLHGPTGSGKTFLARQIAESLGQKCIVQQIISGMAEHHLLGLYAPDAEGLWRWLPSGLADAMLEGHLYVADEIDAGDANTLTIMHTVLAERRLYVPYNQDGARMIDAHPTFRFIATANTVSGANRRYTARNTLDAATLNRFRLGMIHIGYDTDMEKTIVGNMQVCQWGWNVREVIEAHALPHDMSTRNLVDSARMIGAGLTLDDCKSSYFADWTPEARRYAESAGCL